MLYVHKYFRISEEFKKLDIEIDRNTVGVALLVSNDYSTLGTNEELSFTHRDADNLEQLLKNKFDYIVYRKKNISGKEFESYQKTLSEFKYPSTCRRLIVYFSGHGVDGSLLMQDGDIVQVDNLVTFFDPEIASNEIMLIEVAKIFLIDAYSLKVEKVDDCPLASAKPQGRITCLRRIPKVFNILVAYACTQYRSASEVSIGRRWSNCLVKTLRESRERDDICGILTKANQLIRELPGGQYHNVVADFTSNLTREVYFKHKTKQCKGKCLCIALYKLIISYQS